MKIALFARGRWALLIWTYSRIYRRKRNIHKTCLVFMLAGLYGFVTAAWEKETALREAMVTPSSSLIRKYFVRHLNLMTLPNVCPSFLHYQMAHPRIGDVSEPAQPWQGGPADNMAASFNEAFQPVYKVTKS